MTKIHVKKNILLNLLLLVFFLSAAQADNAIVNQLLAEFESQGAVSADINQGKVLWEKTFTNIKPPVSRSCASCHTKNMTNTGKHLRTNKEIKPMSPAVNPQRFSSIKKVNKWFKRNCKWTLGRECTAQEKSNLLTYISTQSKF